MESIELTDALAQRLGHSFSDLALPLEALTHPSVEGVERGAARFGYQRLEFLGDRVLGLVIADMLMASFPDEQEGALSRRHTALVKRKPLATVARDVWQIGPLMRLSRSEQRAGGQENEGILADMAEALIGAVYLDAGYGAAKGVIEPAWRPLLDRLDEPPVDVKSQLQEWAQSRGFPLPSYEILGQSGPDHAPVFQARVSLPGQGGAEGEAGSKQAAEKAAAKAMMAQLATRHG